MDPDHLLSELGWTRRLALGLVGGDESEAADVAQDTWVATWRARPEAGRPLRPWLRQVAMNLVRGRLRGARRRRTREEDSAAARPAVATPEELMQRAELHRRLVELVLALDEPLRVTVLQRYFEGRSAVAIAAASGTPAGTVRWRLKTALDQLRAGLAPEREEGAWRRALLPLLWDPRPRPAPAGGALVAAVGGMVLVGAALLLMLARAGQNFPSAATSEVSVAGPPAAAPPPPDPARARAGLPTCLKEIARAQPELAKLRTARHQWMMPRKLFQDGTPNPRAWLELDGLIRRIIAGDEPVFPNYVFECRTWACKLVLYQDDLRGQPGPPRPALPSLAALAAAKANPMDVFRRYEPGWNMRIQTDPDFLPRVRNREMRPGTPSTDPLSGKAVMQNEIYFTIFDPSGRPPAPGVPGFVPPSWGQGAPVPATAEACAQSRQALGDELARLRTEVDTLTPAVLRYQRGADNPALAREFASHVEQVTGQPLVAKKLAVECRGQLCQLKGGQGTFDLESVARPLLRQGPMQAQLDRLASGNEWVLFQVSSKDRIDGNVLLDERISLFKANGHLAACAAKHGASGTLRVRLNAASAGGLWDNDDGEKGAISVRIGGQLGGTSFAECVAEAIDREIVAPGLPPVMKGAVRDELWRVP